MKRLLWLGLLVFVVLFGFCFSLLSDREPKADIGEAVSAWVACQQFVEERLKAPSTVEYPSPYTEYTRSVGGGTFEVDAYVDAENSFGAMIRTDFLCTVDYRGDDNWHLESLTFSE